MKNRTRAAMYYSILYLRLSENRSKQFIKEETRCRQLQFYGQYRITMANSFGDTVLLQCFWVEFLNMLYDYFINVWFSHQALGIVPSSEILYIGLGGCNGRVQKVWPQRFYNKDKEQVAKNASLILTGFWEGKTSTSSFLILGEFCRFCFSVRLCLNHL